MRVRRMWSVVCVTGLVAALGITGAAPALAAPAATVDCLASPGVDLVLVAGETLTLDVSNCYSVASNLTAVTTPAEVSYECTDGEPGTDPRVGFSCFVNTGPGITRWTVTVADPLVVGTIATFYAWDDARSVVVTSVAGPSQGPAVPIPAWVQAHGRSSADAPCLDGWNPSWDLWPNEGTGGFVCQREVPSLG